MLMTEHERPVARLAPGSIIERSDLLAVIGHDLRQPLSAALMAVDFAAALLEEGSHGEIVRSQLGIVQRCMRQAVRLADDLLWMGQAGAGALHLRCTPVHLPSLLE